VPRKCQAEGTKRPATGRTVRSRIPLFMSHESCYISAMPRGDGPRLVVDVGVELKHRFHVRLAADRLTVKGWLTERIEKYLDGEQLPLALDGIVARVTSTEPPRRLQETEEQYESSRKSSVTPGRRRNNSGKRPKRSAKISRSRAS